MEYLNILYLQYRANTGIKNCMDNASLFFKKDAASDMAFNMVILDNINHPTISKQRWSI